MKIRITKLTRHRKLILIAAFFFNLNNTQAEQSFVSSYKQVHLLELFSTQSCSSCPPAQAWISNLKNSPMLWKTFVPIVFHVDYWDYLGWKDPYSKAEYSQRQKQYVNEWLNSGAYTPMFVLDGKENRNRLQSELETSGSRVGILKAIEKSKLVYDIEFSPNMKNSEALYINYAVLGNEITTQITSGENEGLKLKHDFLSLKAGQMLLKGKNQIFTGRIKINLEKSPSESQRALVFWVSKGNSLKPLQAVGGPIKD